MRRFLTVMLLLSLMMGLTLPAAAAKPYEGQTVDVLFMAVGPMQDFGNLVADFEERYGAKVNFVMIGEKNYDAKADMELLSRKGAYDVIWVPWRTFHRWVRAGWLSPLDEFMNDKDLVDEELLDLDGFAPNAYRALQVNGKQMALPVMMGGLLLHYRTDVFADHGLGSPPDTWEQVEQYAAKIHSEEIAGVGMRGSKAGGGVGFHFPMVLKAFGGSIVKDYPEDMHPNLTDPKSIAAAQFYKDLLTRYGFPGVISAHFLECVLTFQQGKVAILPSSNVLTGQLLDPEKSQVVGKVGFAPIPRGEAGRVAASAVHGLAVPSNAPDKELGFKFIEWALSEDTQFANCIKNHSSSVTRPGVMMKPEYLEMFNWGDGKWAEVVSETFARFADPLYRPMTPEWREVEEQLAIAMSKILSGQQDPAAAFKEADDAIYEIYKQAGYYNQ